MHQRKTKYLSLFLLLTFLSPTFIALHHNLLDHIHDEITICDDKIHTLIKDYWGLALILNSKCVEGKRIVPRKTWSTPWVTVSIVTQTIYSIKNKAPPSFNLSKS